MTRTFRYFVTDRIHLYLAVYLTKASITFAYVLYFCSKLSRPSPGDRDPNTGLTDINHNPVNSTRTHRSIRLGHDNQVLYITVTSYERHRPWNHRQLDRLFNTLFSLTTKIIHAHHYWIFLSPATRKNVKLGGYSIFDIGHSNIPLKSDIKFPTNVGFLHKGSVMGKVFISLSRGQIINPHRENSPQPIEAYVNAGHKTSEAQSLLNPGSFPSSRYRLPCWRHRGHGSWKPLR